MKVYCFIHKCITNGSNGTNGCNAGQDRIKQSAVIAVLKEVLVLIVSVCQLNLDSSANYLH